MSANNAYAYSQWMCMEALRVLKNQFKVANKFTMKYTKEFDREFAVGQTVQVPFPQQWTVTSGLGFQPQGINTQFTTVNIDQVKGIHWAFDSFDEALKLQRGTERQRVDFVEAPMVQLAQEVDTKSAEFATYNTPNVVGALGVNPSSMTTYNQARARLKENAAPPGLDKQDMIISPQMQVSIGSAVQTVFNPTGAISDIWREGQLAKNAYGFGNWWESMSLINTVADTWQGAVTVSGAGQSGTTLLVNCTSGDTFTRGTPFDIDAVQNANPLTRQGTGTNAQFVITQTVTASASTQLLNIYPAIVGPGVTPTDGQYQNVSALPGNTAALSMYPGTTSPNGKTGRNGLAINEIAYAIAGVKLAAPAIGGPVRAAAQKTDPETGLSIRFISMFNNQTSQWENRFDMAFGFGVLRADRGAVRVLSLN